MLLAIRHFIQFQPWFPLIQLHSNWVWIQLFALLSWLCWAIQLRFHYSFNLNFHFTLSGIRGLLFNSWFQQSLTEIRLKEELSKLTKIDSAMDCWNHSAMNQAKCSSLMAIEWLVFVLIASSSGFSCFALIEWNSFHEIHLNQALIQSHSSINFNPICFHSQFRNSLRQNTLPKLESNWDWNALEWIE